MALTVTLEKGSLNVSGNQISNLFTIDFDSSYPTNGESLTVRTLGLTKAINVQGQPQGGYHFKYDLANSKLQAYTTDVGTGLLAEVSNGTNLSTLTGVRLKAEGY